MSRWIEFVRKWAKDHDTTYSCALSQPDCKNEYRAKYGNRKKLPIKKERELMGMEDKDAGEEIYILPKKKPKKQKLIIEEGEINFTPNYKYKQPLIEELKKKIDNKKELLEMSRMMGEDYNTLKGKVGNEVAKIENKVKSRGRPRKYATKEEAYKAKIDQNRGYKQAEAKRIKELIEQIKNK